MKRMAIFASGAGTNAAKIIEHFSGNTQIEIALIVCNKPNAGVLTIATNNHIPILLIEKENFFRGDAYLPQLKAAAIDFIILAGFLWKVPEQLIAAYHNKIINIHPALLPKYGGKGMYGNFVHEAVIANREQESGITIHMVNEQYDSGTVLLQKKVKIDIKKDTPETLAAKVLKLEHTWYSKVIDSLVSK